jgi:hypothetical protein
VDSFGYNENNQRFEFDTKGPSLFRIGDTWQRDELILRTRFRLQEGTTIGQGGVFWALALSTGDDQISSCCWSLSVGRVHPAAAFAMEIEQLRLGPNSGRLEVLRTSTIRKVPLSQSNVDLYDLVVHVNRWQVTRVYVNGISVLDAPVPLQSSKEWHLLKNTDKGVFGRNGSFSFETFSSE